MIKIWYYKPWAYHPRVNPQYVFDKYGNNVLERKPKEDNHPLDVISKHKVKNIMVEVPRDV